MFGQIEQSVGVTPLIVIPRNDFMEVLVEAHSRMFVEYGGMRIVGDIG
jgi:hypothetical protein